MSEGATDESNARGNGLVIKGLVAVALLVAVAGGTALFVKQKPEVLGLAKSSEESQAEIDQLLSNLGKLMTLPSDERPTVATVTDVDKVKEQAFFKNAQNGDKVLIYPNARRAILYRPTENRIIEVGAVNINQASPTPISEESLDEVEPIETQDPEETEDPSPEPSPEEEPEE